MVWRSRVRMPRTIFLVTNAIVFCTHARKNLEQVPANFRFLLFFFPFFKQPKLLVRKD